MPQQIGVGAKLEYESGSTWTEIEFLKSVNFPNVSVTSIDGTHLGLTDYGKTYFPGMIDAGDISFTASYTPESYTSLNGLLRDVIGWRVSDPDGTDAVTCDGFLTSLQQSMTPDEEVMITGTVKMTGVPVLS